MHSLSRLVAVVALGFASLSSAVPAASGCATTTIIFETSFYPSSVSAPYTSVITTTVTAPKTKTSFRPTTTLTKTLTSTATIVTQTTVIPFYAFTTTSTSTTTIGGLTTTIGTACEQCASPTTTVSNIYTEYKPSTVTSTQTLTSTKTRFISSTTVVSTATSGGTTKRVTSTKTQVTKRATTSTEALTIHTVLTTSTQTTTIVSVVTKSIKPTATISVELFSLQAYGGEFSFDPGYAEEFNGDTGGLQQADDGLALVPQTDKVWQYFVRNGLLYEYSTGTYAAIDCADEGCDPRYGVYFLSTSVPQLPGPCANLDPDEECPELQGYLNNCTAVCGQPLTCQVTYYDGTEGGRIGFIFDSEDYVYFSPGDTDPSYNGGLFAVPPTKGKSTG